MSRPQTNGGAGRPDPDDYEALRLELIGAAISPELARLGRTLVEQGHPVASQLEFVRLITGVTAGSAWNGYTMARLQGGSREESRAHPATAPLLAIVEFLGADAPPDLQERCRIFLDKSETV